ncbi:hypothetical protein K432DRAFT_396481 [Lepidopterella palustris CBS 459.81]|uniref:Chromatin assembly factor 1 subunit A n=1 Tax=Lepidopterella palustris CBS 459.81 TaxID=1314670 RepID=A0A8E2E2X3_9PEZI|nr:hypothetical protein K432DRAFT_396481 [Lepidopterella palustris CBS 459.81]
MGLARSPSPSPSDTSTTSLTVLSTQPIPPSSLYPPTARQPSPIPSSHRSSNGDGPEAIQNATTTSGAQTTKRRKLTATEKEKQRQEKEAKEKAKAELKAQKEEEKRARDEERRKKNEEKEEKKRAKELELQQKEGEKRKKERSQMKLNAFFMKPKKASTESPVKPSSLVEEARKRSTELLEPGGTLQAPTSGPPSPIKPSPRKKIAAGLTDYERCFLPFELPSRAVLAPYNRFILDQDKLDAARKRLDAMAQHNTATMELSQPETFKACLSQRAPRGASTMSVRDIIARLHGSLDNPIDLTNEDTRSAQQPLKLLEAVRMKYLHFSEDVRPPYYGTFTKFYTPLEAARLARNPFRRGLRETDYDYDSEAEWEEPEEGEDLDSEGEDDADSAGGDDDLESFLDDEDAAENKRRLISGDLEPVSTGLCWEDMHGVSRRADGSGEICHDFKGFRLEVLLDPQPRTIDPFSTAYWEPTFTPASNTLAVPVKETAGSASSGLMNPPRLPLTSRPNCMANGMTNTFNKTSSDPKASKLTVVSAASSKLPKLPKRMVPPEQLQEFKDAIQGSDLTKIALVEALKKRFPKLPKDVINNTLGSVAARLGAKEVDKRWVLLSG